MSTPAHTILIIEDDPHIVKALSIRLTHAGYDVITASDGLQGLKSAIDRKPDLIISDIWMPGSVGFLVAERMKCFGLASIPVIFITASKKKNLCRLAKEVGAAALFEKPFNPEELLATVARCLHPAGAGRGEGVRSSTSLKRRIIRSERRSTRQTKATT